MFSLVFILTACNDLPTSGTDGVDGQDGTDGVDGQDGTDGSSSDDGVEAVDSIDDLDGNGIDDYGNQSYAFGETEVGVAVGFLFSATLPVNAGGQSYSLFGSGNDEYVAADNGWETAFLPLPEMTDSEGYVVGYGAQGIRDGNYTAQCGLNSAIPHTTTGWCRPDQGLTANDDTGYLVALTNGSPDCAGLPGYSSSGYITTYAYRFSVINGRLAKIQGDIPVDPTCYAY